jgi:hypothetical protein
LPKSLRHQAFKFLPCERGHGGTVGTASAFE